jgi:hypothetical protein
VTLLRLKQDTVTTRKNTRLTDRVVTTNATPATAFSISLGSGRHSFGTFRIIAVKSDLTEMSTFYTQAAFRRPPGGNVTAVGTPKIDIMTDWSTPSGTRPMVSFAANTGTQSIDIVVTGRAATTINWYLEIVSIQNLS